MNNPQSPSRARRVRTGFTLVEMLVAMALSLGIMLILTEAFRISLDFIRGANSTAVMITQLNGAGASLQRDLSLQHFLPEDPKQNQGIRLSDQRIDQLTPAGQGWTTPISGFFRIMQQPRSATDTVDDPLVDYENFSVTTTSTHALHFTSIYPVGAQQNTFSVLTASNGAYASRAAEIAYFLVGPVGKTSVPNGRPLYNLVRRYRLVAMSNDDRSLLTPGAADTNVIAGNGTTAFTLQDVTNPANRMALNAATFPVVSTSALTFGVPGAARYGEDILASNVLSFEVLADWTPNAFGVAAGATSPRAFAIGVNTEAPYDYFQNGQVFDTYAQLSNAPFTMPAQAIRIKSIQVHLRIFDPKVKQARQNTWKFYL
jgi:prepilin-type N-terminal cleavage/methylation domain-containing protein